ncbi:MAG: hypothetical protein DI585_02570 [Pseudomonas fluorescens]|nr:MAG: hypothetical protein DI585_02570 [Pseudomonas fluorescens]
MKNYIVLSACVLAAGHAEASPLSHIFGKEQPAVGTPLQVEGPLLQVQTEGGTTLSFQHGSSFEVKDDGAVDLKKGNLRVGPAGGDTLKLALPNGEAEIEPLSAVTITVDKGKASGRVYQGSMNVMGRTFTSGEGFEVTAKGAHATFTPQPAQAPALNSQPMPADEGKVVVAVTDKTELKRWVPVYSMAGEDGPNKPNEMPQPTDPTPETPQPEIPPVTTPQPEVPGTQPNPDTPEVPVTPPDETPEVPTTPPDTPEIPQQVKRDIENASIAFSGTDVSEGLEVRSGQMTLGAYVDENGTLNMDSVESSVAGLDPVRLFKGTAEVRDVQQIGNTAGLGRWVGGHLVAVKNGMATDIANHVVRGEGEEAVTIPNSVHFVWGERATQLPTSGRVEYALHSATQPTYSVRDGSAVPESTGNVFNGTLAVDFRRTYSGNAGTYHLNGAVTAAGENQVYTMATGAGGVGFKETQLSNLGGLNVTSGADAIACPGGTCSGTVNMLGFGTGMTQAGVAYSINPTGNVGMDGAALFVANP